MQVSIEGKQMNPHSKLNALLGFEFQKYLMQNPEIADQIPSNTLLIFQIDGDEEFNKWNLETSLKNREKDQPVVRVSLRKWREKSLLEDLEISEAA